MGDTITYPTKVSLPLKARPDIVPACPEVDRCQLEVIHNTDPALIIEDGPAYYRKLVKVGVVREGGGCDVKVRVGVVESGGPIAHGKYYTETTTTTITRRNTVSGEFISRTQTVNTVYLGWFAAEGETVTTTSEDVGFDTYTTVVEVVVARHNWEVKLLGCVAPTQRFLPKAPQHLLNVRYMASGEPVSLTVYQSDDDGISWVVKVDRPTAAQPLVLTFTPQEDDLRVSAALSPNCRALYVITSRDSLGEKTARYYHYTYSHSPGEWALFSSGTVPKPYTTGNPNHYFVDRNGDIAGYWAAVSTARLVDETSGSGFCINNLELGYGFDRNERYLDHTDYYGGVWNINMQRYIGGDSRRKGVTVGQGDIVPVTEVLTNTHPNYRALYNSYWWKNGVIVSGEGDVPQIREHYREYENVLKQGLTWSLTINETSAIAETFDDESYFRMSASLKYKVQTLITPAIVEEWQTFHEHYDFIGFEKSIVSSGGWVSVLQAGTLTVADDMAERYTHTEYPNPNNITTPCRDLRVILTAIGMTEHEIDSKKIIYPVELGEYVWLHRSFSAVNGSENYYGAMYATESGVDPEWKVYRNGGDVTAAIERCTGRPIMELCGIFWRA